MTFKEYMSSIAGNNIDTAYMESLKSKYCDNLPEAILEIFSNAENTVFLKNSRRVLSYDEVMNASEELHVGFKEMGLIPIVDCGENNFIVYQFKEHSYAMFNITDETLFMIKSSLDEYF